MKIKPYDYAPVGERVKNARVMRELTQEQVANYIGVNSKHLSSVERGERGLSISSLMDLCKFLDIDADYILFGTITRDNNNPLEYVANKLGVSSQHISEIERGLSGLSIPSLMEICRILDIDADYILFGTVTRDNHNPLNEILVKMTPEQSSHAEEIIKAYAKSFGIIS